MREWSLSFFQLSGISHWFLNLLRGLIYLMSNPMAGVPNM